MADHALIITKDPYTFSAGRGMTDHALTVTEDSYVFTATEVNNG